MTKNNLDNRPVPINPQEKPADDWRYRLMELPEEDLLKKVNNMPREELIQWLAWNDPNGVFLDEDSIAEGYEPLTKEHAAMCVFAVIMRSRANWSGYMGEKYLKGMDLAVHTDI